MPILQQKCNNDYTGGGCYHGGVRPGLRMLCLAVVPVLIENFVSWLLTTAMVTTRGLVKAVLIVPTLVEAALQVS